MVIDEDSGGIDNGEGNDKIKNDQNSIEESIQGHPSKFQQYLLPLEIAYGNNPSLSADQLQYLSALELIRNAFKDLDICKKLFEEADMDGSGELDNCELAAVLRKLGFPNSESLVMDIIELYDVNASGVIEYPEFEAFIRHEYSQAIEKIHELSMIPMYIVSTPVETHSSSATLPMASYNDRYRPPKEGILKLSVIDSLLKPIHRILTPLTMQRLMQYTHWNVQRHDFMDGDISHLLTALQSRKLRLHEAVQLVSLLHKYLGNLSIAISLILPLMHTSLDARKLLNKATKGDRYIIQKITSHLGKLTLPYLGIVDGYYALDLSKQSDRECLKQLLVVANQSISTGNDDPPSNEPIASDASNSFEGENSLASTEVIPPVQRSCLRNDRMDWKSVKINPLDAKSLEQLAGALEFDFISEYEQEMSNEASISDSRLMSLLMNSCLLNPEDVPMAAESLFRYERDHGDLTNACLADETRRQLIEQEVDEFNKNLPRRKDLQNLVNILPLETSDPRHGQTSPIGGKEQGRRHSTIGGHNRHHGDHGHEHGHGKDQAVLEDLEGVDLVRSLTDKISHRTTGSLTLSPSEFNSMLIPSEEYHVNVSYLTGCFTESLQDISAAVKVKGAHYHDLVICKSLEMFQVHNRFVF